MAKYGIVEFFTNAYLRFRKGSNTIDVKAPAAITTSYAYTLPATLPGSTQALTVDSSGQWGYTSLSGGGSVTSVALSLPSIFTVSGSPVTASGTLSATLNSQTQGLIFASPAGASGAPTFRALAWSDVSALAGTTSSSFAVGNDSRFHTQGTDTGTTQASFQLNSGSAGVRLKDNSGVLELRNSADNAFADIRVKDLFVTGTTTTINSETITVDDNVIVLNNNVSSGTPTEDLGIEGRRGASTSASLKWIESSSRWSAGLVGSEIALARVYQTTFTNASLTAGVLTVTHNLGRQVVKVQIADDTNKDVAGVDDITFSSTSQLTIDLTSAGTLSGTWTVVVVG